ncbi:MAG: hypothetical protein FWF08_03540 [Oscillospiraceae bacterium]|nr:hypothetical protein [Oscillospiraceae bacterium]
MKKGLCVLLAVMMALGTFAISASAASGDHFDDLAMQQVYDYDKTPSNVNVVLQANYSNEGFGNISVALVNVYAVNSDGTTGSVLGVTNSGGNIENNVFYVWFNLSNLSEVTPRKVKVKLNIYYRYGGTDLKIEGKLVDATIKKVLDKSDIDALLVIAGKKFNMRYKPESWLALESAQKEAIKFVNDINRQDYDEYESILTGFENALYGLEPMAEGILDYLFALIEMMIGMISGLFKP